MSALDNVNPIAAFLWLMMVAGIAMFCFNPAILAISLLGALLFFISRNPDARPSAHLPYLLLFALSVLINPLFNHNGATVLFVLNDNPVTLEAIYYGAAMGGMVLAVLYWFRSFQQIMTSDKLLYVFGSALPKLTLILSIALRYIPLLRKQTRRVRDAQKALGLFREENLLDRLRGELRIFSVLVSWALENGIITADSMCARGYGIGRRTRFALFRFQLREGLMCLGCLLLGGCTIAAIACGALACSFYPRYALPSPNALGCAAYASYTILALFPALLEVEERIRWKSLKLKI
ncbi:MAG: energy-coupling factor transporter transmembrane component T [Clostridia bacterium]|nr:energy-coupling factor transporter transmembrane component T [Clostridia bacterium]